MYCSCVYVCFIYSHIYFLVYVNYQHQLNTQLLNMSDSSQVSDRDGKMDNKAKDSVDNAQQTDGQQEH